MRKRIVTTLIICIIAVLGALSFTACKNGNGGDEASVVGSKYVFVDCTCTVNGETNEEVTNAVKDLYKDLYFEFKEDGVLEYGGISNNEGDIEFAEKGTYKQDGNKITVVVSNSFLGDTETSGVIDGNQIVFTPPQPTTMQSIKLYFELANED